MNDPSYFTDRSLQVGFNINLVSHNRIHNISLKTIKPNFNVFGTKTGCIKKNLEEMSVIYVRLINQYIFKNQTVISAIFIEQCEDGLKEQKQVYFKILILYQQNLILMILMLYFH